MVTRAKKSKSDAKQRNISAAFSAQEFKALFYDSGGKIVLQVMQRRRWSYQEICCEATPGLEETQKEGGQHSSSRGASLAEDGDHEICHQPSYRVWVG